METDERKDGIFEKMASFYVEQEGEKIIDEFPDSTSLPSFDSETKLQISIRRRDFWQKTKKGLLIAVPAAACLLIFLLLSQSFILNQAFEPSYFYNNEHIMSPPATSDPTRVEIASLSDKLPEGCMLTKTDYDKGRTIYHIKNNRNNDIVLAAEHYSGSIDTSDFTPTKINGQNAYILSKKNHNILLVQSEGILYTYTSAFDAHDLLEIASAIL